MRARQLLTLVLALVTAASLTLSSASSASAPRVIRLISIGTAPPVEVDKPPAGPSVGDTQKQSSRLLNAAPQFGKPKGAVVGKDSGTIRLVGPDQATFTGTTRLPGGTLRLSGRIVFVNNGFVVAVVGGTGVFNGAKGTVRVTATADENKSLNVYTLTYPAGSTA